MIYDLIYDLIYLLILTQCCVQEIGVLRQQILACEGELRTVSSPAYTARDRDRALAEQSVSDNNQQFFCLSCLSSLSFSLKTILYFCSVLLCFPCNKFLVSAVYFCSDETRVASVLISRRVSNLLCHNYRLPENESRDSSRKSRHLVKE